MLDSVTRIGIGWRGAWRARESGDKMIHAKDIFREYQTFVYIQHETQLWLG